MSAPTPWSRPGRGFQVGVPSASIGPPSSEPALRLLRPAPERQPLRSSGPTGRFLSPWAKSRGGPTTTAHRQRVRCVSSAPRTPPPMGSRLVEPHGVDGTRCIGRGPDTSTPLTTRRGGSGDPPNSEPDVWPHDEWPLASGRRTARKRRRSQVRHGPVCVTGRAVAGLSRGGRPFPDVAQSESRI